MADDPTGQRQSTDIASALPDVPAEEHPSNDWPDHAGMVAQQQAANEMFRENSERLQSEGIGPTFAPEAENEIQGLPSTPTHGNFVGLKAEQAKTMGADESERSEPEAANLDFVPDRNPQSFARLKAEQALALNADPRDRAEDRDELDFVKDRQRKEQERDEPSRPEAELTFVKDRSPGPDRGR